MKVEKNKIVFAAVILCVVLFIVGYAMMALGGDEEPSIDINQIPVPELGEEQEQYKTKLEALDAIKEERQTNAPSIYDEGFLDSTGVYDPDLMEKKRCGSLTVSTTKGALITRKEHTGIPRQGKWHWAIPNGIRHQLLKS